MTETEKESDLSDLSEYESEKESEDENEEIDPNQLADFPTIVKLGRLFFSTFFIKYYKKKLLKVDGTQPGSICVFWLDKGLLFMGYRRLRRNRPNDY